MQALLGCVVYEDAQLLRKQDVGYVGKLFQDLMVMLGTIVVTGYLYYVIPKGFFPEQDTGMILGIGEAAQDISYPAMAERMQAVVNVLLKDPDVASVGSNVGPGGPTATLNQGRMFIALKPRDQRRANAMEIIKRLQPQLAKIEGITLYMQPAQDITIGGRLNKTQYQYTLNDADSNELNHWAAIFLAKLKTLPQITDVATDQENFGPLLDVTVNREVASSSAFCLRRSTTFSTMPSASASSRPSTPRSTNITSCSRSIHASNIVRTP